MTNMMDSHVLCLACSSNSSIYLNEKRFIPSLKVKLLELIENELLWRIEIEFEELS